MGCWVGLLLWEWADPRRCGRPLYLSLVLVVSALSVWVAIDSATGIARWPWWITSGMGGADRPVSARKAARSRVLSSAPLVHASSGEGHLSTSGGEAHAAAQRATSERHGAFLALATAGTAASVIAALSSAYIHAASLPPVWRYGAALQTLGTLLLLGVSLFCAVQLTLVSTFEEFAGDGPACGVRWGRVKPVAILAGLLLAAACLGQFWLAMPRGTSHSVETSAEWRLLVAGRAFGLILLFATLLGAMIPSRLAACQRSKTPPRDWVTMALAAWLSLLCFLLIAALPGDWPWTALLLP